MPNFSGIWTSTQQMQAIGQGIWPAVPGAPTIGTATAASATTATVAFTAPANAGYPATITGYTATSSPGGLTGTGTSPITVSGLTTGTAYTFTVTATNASGTGPPSASSNSITPIPTIGSAYAGGFYAGQIGTDGVATHFLVVAPKASGQSSITLPYSSSLSITGSSSNINGPANTATLIALGGSSYPAANFCNNLVTGGFDDWYMPAINELKVCYVNLKPGTASNVTSLASGENPNSIPVRTTAYTAGSPAQTSVSAFQLGGSEAFDQSNYWGNEKSSSPYYRAYYMAFYNGYRADALKTNERRIRAVRRVAV